MVHKLRELIMWGVTITLVLAACSSSQTGTLSGQSGLSAASQLTLEQADQVAQTFLKAWKNRLCDHVQPDHPNSRDAYTEAEFAEDTKMRFSNSP
jgi:hypothetical protein